MKTEVEKIANLPTVCDGEVYRLKVDLSEPTPQRALDAIVELKRAGLCDGHAYRLVYNLERARNQYRRKLEAAPLRRAELLADQIKKSWEPPGFGKGDFATAAQTIAMQAIAFTFGIGVLGSLSSNQAAAIDQGLAIMNAELLGKRGPNEKPNYHGPAATAFHEAEIVAAAVLEKTNERVLLEREKLAAAAKLDRRTLRRRGAAGATLRQHDRHAATGLLPRSALDSRRSDLPTLHNGDRAADVPGPA